MDSVNLGTTGLRVSRICLGMMSFGNDSDRAWVLDEDGAEPIVRAAVEAGIYFFDTANAYSNGASEVATGRLVTKYLSRDEAVIATKVFMPMTPGPNGGGLSRKHILAAIDASLQRLDIDYVDLYQIHRYDLHTPIEETMDALDDVVRAGQGALHRREQHARVAVREGAARGRAGRSAKFVSMQNHYNLIYREEEREMIPQCLDQGVGVIPWSPLARGVLAGNRTRRASGSPPGRTPTRSPTTCTTSRLTSTSSSAWSRSPASAVSRRRRSRSRGCCTSPASPRRSSARRSSTICDDARRGGAARAGRRGDRAARGALRAAPRLGHRAVGGSASRRRTSQKATRSAAAAHTNVTARPDHGPMGRASPRSTVCWTASPAPGVACCTISRVCSGRSGATMSGTKRSASRTLIVAAACRRIAPTPRLSRA